MSTLASIRRQLAVISLLSLAACQGDPTASLGPTAAPRHAIAPENVIISELGTPQGESEVNPEAVSKRGYVLASGGLRAEYLFFGGTWSEITGFGEFVRVAAVNDSGDIVATGSNGPTQTLLLRGSAVTVLPMLGDGDYAFANDIDNAGDVVGSYSSAATGVTDAVIWRSGAAAPELLPRLSNISGPPGTQLSAAYAMNDAGQIVGESSLDGRRAVLWDNGVVRDLGTLGEPGGAAQDINERGEIVGSSFVSPTVIHAFI